MSKPMPKLSSMFAILDVKRGRKALEQLYKSQPDLRIPVVIRGYIAGPHSRDDGESIEFSVLVTHLELPDDTP